MPEEKKIVIREIDDPVWKEKVRRDAIGGSFGGGEMPPFSPPQVRNPSEVNFTPVEEARIIGEARIDKKLTK